MTPVLLKPSRRKTDKVHALKLNFAPQKNCVVVVCGGNSPPVVGVDQDSLLDAVWPRLELA